RPLAELLLLLRQGEVHLPRLLLDPRVGCCGPVDVFTFPAGRARSRRIEEGRAGGTPVGVGLAAGRGGVGGRREEACDELLQDVDDVSQESENVTQEAELEPSICNAEHWLEGAGAGGVKAEGV